MNAHDDIPEYERFCALVRAAVPDPGVRCDIIIAAIEYASARALKAIDNVSIRLEKAND